MAAPALRVPLSLNMQEFERNIESARNKTGEATRFIVRQFLAMNVEIAKTGTALAVGSGMAAGALALASRISLVVGAVTLLSAAIGNARQQLAQMVELADKARDVGVSPTFFQAFTEVGRGSTERIEALQGALERAFQSLKPVLNPDWSVWDQGLTKVTEVEKAMREMRELFTTDQSFGGLDQFRTAQNQDQKLQAVLAFMIQLRNIGQEVAALDLAERVFGREFADNVRRGKESIDDLYNTIERKLKKPDVTDELVKEAKELDDRLTKAYQTINDNLTPSWRALASAAAEIKGYWTSIVELIARATTASQNAAPGQNRTVGFDPERNPNDLNTPALPRVNVPTVRERQLQREQSAQAAGSDAFTSFNDFSGAQPQAAPVERIPLPVRRPSDIPQERVKELQEEFDAVERLINIMQRSNEVLEAELGAVGKSNVEREKAVALARAEAAARQRGEELTVEERDAVLQLAEAHAQLADRMEKVRSVQNEIREFGSSLGDAFKSLVIEGQRLDQVMTSLLNRLASRAIDGAFDSLFRSLGSSIGGSLFGGTAGTSTFGINPIAGAFNFGGGRASGGPVSPNQVYRVGEQGEEWFVPNSAGQIVPNDIVRNAGGMSVPISIPIDARGADPAAIARLEGVVARLRAELPAIVVDHVREARTTRNL